MRTVERLLRTSFLDCICSVCDAKVPSVNAVESKVICAGSCWLLDHSIVIVDAEVEEVLPSASDFMAVEAIGISLVQRLLLEKDLAL